VIDQRDGLYLRPSPAMCHAQAEIHALLERQYSLRAAGRFMPHATLKGFFRSEATPAEMVARLDPVLAAHAPFPAASAGVAPLGPGGIVFGIQHLAGGQINQALRTLHEETIAALLPLVHPACDVTPGEWHGDRFDAHVTLAMADIPLPFFDEILQFLRDLGPIGPPGFVVDRLHRCAVTSDDWAGAWWETLGWRLLHGWRLGSEAG